jgi:hypothetical protein
MRFVLASFFCLNAFGATAPTTLLDAQPVRFEPNPGLGQASSAVKWSARGPGYAFLFMDDATVLRTSAGAAKLTFVGSTAAAKFTGEHALSAHINYFRGREHASVSAYTRLRREQIYPGIDLVFYGTGHDIEYDFEIAPGADASRIRMRFEGSQSTRLNDRGEIVLKLNDGEITQRRPVVYQRDASGKIAAVDAEYILDDSGTARVRLGKYNRNQALVVDPSITYRAYVQGSSIDTVVAIGHDSQGRVYMAGNTFSLDFPITSQAYQTTFGTTTTTSGVTTTNGIQNVWVMQLDPTLGGSAIVYCSYLGGEATDTAMQMTVDANGVMYVTGFTDSGTYPVTSGAYLGTYSGNVHAFVSMVDPSQQGAASLVYSTFFGGTNSDFAAAIAVAAGKIYITGWTTSTDLPLLNASQTTLNGGQDAFMAEFDPTQSGSASLLASTYLGGSLEEEGHAIAVDSNGLVYVAGQTFSFDFPTTSNSNQPAYGGGGDGFLTVLNPSASTVTYSTYVGGSSVDDIKKILITPAGNVAMTGYTVSPDFPVTPGAYQTTYGGNGNAFISVLNTTAPPGLGQGLVYSTFFGGSVGEVAYDLRQDSAGRFYIAGYTMSPDYPVTANALYPTSVGNSIDGFVAVIDPSQPPFSSRALVYSSYLTGPGMQILYGVDVDQNGAIYITGITTSDVFPNATPANTFALKTSVFVLIFTLP